jgi:hypothetical protein
MTAHLVGSRWLALFGCWCDSGTALALLTGIDLDDLP